LKLPGLISNRLLHTRLLIGLVLFFNLQAAIVFITNPIAYLGAFELEGIPGQAALRGTGILFLMWNVPYVVALSHPVQRRVSLYEAIAMQAIGLIGESLLLGGLPPGHETLRTSIMRFILFDSAGLAMLIAAWGFTRKIKILEKSQS
jgi:hypothetical protein